MTTTKRTDEHCTHPTQRWCDCDWCRVLRACTMRATNADECAAMRERSVAGVSDTIPACPVHGAHPDMEETR